MSGDAARSSAIALGHALQHWQALDGPAGPGAVCGCVLCGATIAIDGRTGVLRWSRPKGAWQRACPSSDPPAGTT